MKNTRPSPISIWSTDHVAPAQRLDYYANALATALIPMRVACADETAFQADIRAATVGPISVLRQSGSIHRVDRGPREIASSFGRSLHLLLSIDAAWGLNHRGPVRLAPGDAVLTDSRFAHELEIFAPYRFVNLKLPEDWVEQWIPNSDMLTGRRIPAACGWGSALASFVSQLKPEIAVTPPLPHRVVTDHVGALLAFVAHELTGTGKSPGRGARDLRDRIQEQIVQRCGEFSLEAREVAASLEISARTLHRALAACGLSFGSMLIAARFDLAMRMIESPLARRLTIAEIGRRAGFADASHFARVVKRRTGRTPSEWLRNLRAHRPAEHA